MDIKIYFFSTIFFIGCYADAFNITELLGQYPDLSKFNNYLTQFQLADDINSRQTVTVLAVDNDAISSISNKSDEVLRKIMAVHVLLDYYDIVKLRMMPGYTIQTTTLFQNSGQAIGKQGYMNLTVTLGGELFFGSSTVGSGSTVLAKAIMSSPFNISVMQIRDVIIPIDIDIDTISSPPPAPAPAPAIEAPSPGIWSPGPAPVGSDNAAAPSPFEFDQAPTPAGFVDAPTPMESGDAPYPIESGDAPTPTPFTWFPDGPAEKEPEPEPAKIANGPSSLVVSPGPKPGTTSSGSVSTRFGNDLVVMIVALCTWLALY